MRVLIAHEDEVTRNELGDAVRGCRPGPPDIVMASEGSEALDLLLHDDPPEVALIDWDLAGIEGPEMCRLVRDFHHGHDTWIVVLAGPAHADTADAWRAGAKDCVAAPAPLKVVAEAVTKGLREMAPVREPVAVAARPAHLTLDAVCIDDEVGSEGFPGLTAVLKATVSPEDWGGPAEPAAGPAELSAQCLDLDAHEDEPRGPATLEALLARL